MVSGTQNIRINDGIVIKMSIILRAYNIFQRYKPNEYNYNSYLDSRVNRAMGGAKKKRNGNSNSQPTATNQQGVVPQQQQQQQKQKQQQPLQQQHQQQQQQQEDIQYQAGAYIQ
jgi:hypothetical protein